MKKIFNIKNLSSIENFFVKNGYVVVRGIYDQSKVKSLEKLILKLQKKYSLYKTKFDAQSFSIASHKIFEKNDLYDYFYKNKKLLDLLKVFLGNDIVQVNFSRFQINSKQNEKNKIDKLNEKKFQQFKGIHNDHWTGTSEYTIHYWMPFSGVDKKNAMTFYPGSHLNGSFPVLNREIDPNIEFKYKPHNLDYLKNGDVVIFHSLLLHKTTGKSKKTRMALLSRFCNLNYKISNQEKDVGFRSLSIGPMRKVIRMIGNDFLTPFRTYGGVPGVDRVVREVYNDSVLDSNSLKLYKILEKKIV